MYRLGRTLAKLSVERWSSFAAFSGVAASPSKAANEKILLPATAFLTALFVSTTGTPISISSCGEAVVSMDILTLDWDDFMKKSCILGEDDDDDDDDDDDEEDEDEEEVEDDVETEEAFENEQVKVRSEQAQEEEQVEQDELNQEETVLDDEIKMANEHIEAESQVQRDYKKHWHHAMFKDKKK